MSKIGDAVIQAEEERLEGWKGKWQEDTRKMHELAEQWDGVYPEIEGVFPQKHKDTESDSPPF